MEQDCVRLSKSRTVLNRPYWIVPVDSTCLPKPLVLHAHHPRHQRATATATLQTEDPGQPQMRPQKVEHPAASLRSQLFNQLHSRPLSHLLIKYPVTLQLFHRSMLSAFKVDEMDLDTRHNLHLIRSMFLVFFIPGGSVSLPVYTKRITEDPGGAW